MLLLFILVLFVYIIYSYRFLPVYLPGLIIYLTYRISYYTLVISYNIVSIVVLHKINNNYNGSILLLYT